MEGDPHAVIEGMIVGAYAIGALRGYIYVRHEYPLAVKRLHKAVEQAREFGFLGNKILRSDFNFDIKISQGAGAFVCGEETALIASIEGIIGEPSPRPPYPAQQGSSACPPSSTTSKPGPTSLKSSTWGLNGSRPWAPKTAKAPRSSPWWGRSIKPAWWKCPWAPPCARSSLSWAAASALTGNSRPCRPAAPPAVASPAEFLDLSVDYDSLQSVGSIMGSGGMIVMDNPTAWWTWPATSSPFCMRNPAANAPPAGKV